MYDPFRPTVHADESEAPVRRYLTPYAASKAAAERALEGRPGTVVLRPHAVYGPGDRTLLPRVLEAVRGGRLFLPGDGTAPQSLTHIGNLTAAVLRACDPAAPPGTYNVADAEPVPVGEALCALLAARGVRVRLRCLPARAAEAAAAATETAWRLARRPRPRGSPATRSATSRWSAPSPSTRRAGTSAWTRRPPRSTGPAPGDPAPPTPSERHDRDL